MKSCGCTGLGRQRSRRTTDKREVPWRIASDLEDKERVDRRPSEKYAVVVNSQRGSNNGWREGIRREYHEELTCRMSPWFCSA